MSEEATPKYRVFVHYSTPGGLKIITFDDVEGVTEVGESQRPSIEIERNGRIEGTAREFVSWEMRRQA